VKTTGPNGNGPDDNADRVSPLFPETANENARGVTVLRDIASAMADRVVSADRISARLRYPQPLAALDPPYQATDSTMRGYLQAIAADPMA
jgi:hypothetical protein